VSMMAAAASPRLLIVACPYTERELFDYAIGRKSFTGDPCVRSRIGSRLR